jgi:N-acetylmuramoyl-L-alanine amidase
LIRGLKPGTTTIRATLATTPAIIDSCTVVVKPSKARIYLSPSCQVDNTWAHHSNCNEAQKMLRLSNRVYTYLQIRGFNVYGGRNNIEPAARKNESNDMVKLNPSGINLHICLHSNAPPSCQKVEIPGPEILFHSRKPKSRELSETIYEKLFSLYRQTFRDAKRRRGGTGLAAGENYLLEVRETNAIVAYVEVAYHTEKDDEEWMIKNMDTIAGTIGDGIIEYIGKH